MVSLNILLIDDDEIEIMKLERTLSKLEHNHQLIIAKNGEEALEILKETTPEVIFLDLNMPRMSGLEFLEILKQDERMKYIPVMILSTSRNHKDILESYNLGIAGYIVKPLRFEDYVNKIKVIVDYWSNNELIKVG